MICKFLNVKCQLTILFLSLIIISTDVFAAKLVEMKVVDKDHIMVYFKDGDVNFVDDGLGPTAYISDHDTDNNYVVLYGSALETTNAVAASNWVIKSTDDANYGTTGLSPTTEGASLVSVLGFICHDILSSQ